MCHEWLEKKNPPGVAELYASKVYRNGHSCAPPEKSTSEERAQEIKTMIEQIMVAEMEKLFPAVPIEVEAKVFDTWADK